MSAGIDETSQAIGQDLSNGTPGCLEPTELAARVSAVEGVADLYPVSTLSRAPELLASLLAGAPKRIQSVEVTRDDDGVRVAARIASHRSLPTPDTARQAADALLREDTSGEIISVSVQVSRIA